MPMCDVYIPRDALPAEAEAALLSRLTDLLVDHELRRVVDLSDDPETVEASRKRARSIAWLFVHRTEVYVGGDVREAPYYKFDCRVPEGMMDEEFRRAATGDIVQAVAEAEGGRWPNPEARVWVFTGEVPEGTWGALATLLGLRDVVNWVAPELKDRAQGRLDEHRRDQARALIEAAGPQVVANFGEVSR
jgi:phenylpyruvate tautomerase PptA (4-oxalocrotonate tautomerase family)